ncbi:unnamed protein product [Brachionus calyciflorus]|uniref:Uncharacterized protein n=1 Tax=Brachionus calyciflorus TaxID=104777 RepID=A0A814KK37_9BILA|nr:unnamed protein product [Brachionus calyciflorus]
MIQNRQKCSKMAQDIWILINSQVDGKSSNFDKKIQSKIRTKNGYKNNSNYNYNLSHYGNARDSSKVTYSKGYTEKRYYSGGYNTGNYKTRANSRPCGPPKNVTFISTTGSLSNTNVPTSTPTSNLTNNQPKVNLKNSRPRTSGYTNKPTGENKRKSRVDTDSSTDESVNEVAPKKVSQIKITHNNTLASLNEAQDNQEMQI